MTTRPIRGNPGRPSGAGKDQVRSDLLHAARGHFLSRDFKAVSVKQIAESAGVNGAMVNYYFGSKQGLYLAMVDGMLSEVEANLRAPDPGTKINLADFSDSYCQLLVQNPWWPNFIVREVLFSEGEIREAVIKKFSDVMGALLIEYAKQEIADGHFRSDLDPRLTIISFISMTIFPFLARPVMEKVFQLEFNESTAGRIADHNIRVFMHGVAARKHSGEET